MKLIIALIIALVILYFIFRANWKKIKEEVPASVNQDETEINVEKDPKYLVNECIELLDSVIMGLYERGYDSINPANVLNIFKECYTYVSFLIAHSYRMNETDFQKTYEISLELITKNLNDKLLKYFNKSLESEIRDTISQLKMYYNNWLSELEEEYKSMLNRDNDDLVILEVITIGRNKFLKDLSSYVSKITNSKESFSYRLYGSRLKLSY